MDVEKFVRHLMPVWNYFVNSFYSVWTRIENYNFVHELQAAEGKKVSRAESWRYEASIYVSPGRQKPSGMHVWDINKLERNKRKRERGNGKSS
jgi:hypothetical protein